ncbi:MAG: 4Fe-4S dicluster domain-containing protein [Candidatus Bathyarchaeia archaeon]
MQFYILQVEVDEDMIRLSGDFAREVKSRLGGETIMSCYQCGTCTGSCPVSGVTNRFNPRKLIIESLRGRRDKILSGEALWLCCSCFNCQERCPQKVEIADLIYALRNIAASEGYVPSIYSEFMSTLYSEGKLVKVASFTEKKRSLYGLPPLRKTDVEAIKRILEETSFGKILKVLEEKKG